MPNFSELSILSLDEIISLVRWNHIKISNFWHPNGFPIFFPKVFFPNNSKSWLSHICSSSFPPIFETGEFPTLQRWPRSSPSGADWYLWSWSSCGTWRSGTGCETNGMFGDVWKRPLKLWVFALKMVFFHSYVNVYQRVYIYIHIHKYTDWWCGPFGWFSIYWDFHHPNWRTHIFQDGWKQQPVYIYLFIILIYYLKHNTF